MPIRSDLRDCPHGCPRTDRNVVFYSDYVVQCQKCRCMGPDASDHLAGSRRFSLTETGRRSAAALLWNARTLQEREAALGMFTADTLNRKDLFSSGDALTPTAKRLQPPKAPGAGAWTECVTDHAPFVQGVIYRVVKTDLLEKRVVALDDDGESHTVPAKAFGLLVPA